MIRKATLEDIKDIQHVANIAWHSTYEGILDEKTIQQFLKFAYSEERLSNMIENTFCLVKEKESVIGFINCIQREDNTHEISRFYILPQFQNQGVGTELLNEVKLQLKPLKLQLIVETENEIGINFYKKHNFKIVKQFKESFLGATLNSTSMEWDSRV